MKIRWSGATRYHDWMGCNKVMPAMMIEQLTDAGLLGNLEWVKTGMHGKKEPIGKSGVSISQYLDFKPKRNDLYIILCGGANPFNWELTLALSKFSEDSKMVLGYNNLNLWFEKDDILTNKGSELLFNTFKKVHNADNTEYAFIHPSDRWSELIDPFYGAYKIPVTFNPMFTGVFWSNFLGRGQLELFDKKRIENIITDKIDQKKEDELYIRMTENIYNAFDKTVENEMIYLTDSFRAALI